jgi:propanediol utilization protein
MKTLTSPISTSARHIHLSTADRKTLFGPTPLTKLKDLSQPGQYATTATVSLATDNGHIDHVRILGPDRPQTQVEISATDARTLKIAPPLRLSGDLTATPGITIIAPNGHSLTIPSGVIIAARHLHISSKTAARHHLTDHSTVSAIIKTPRGATLNHITVRISDPSTTDLHLDTDEANALAITPDTTAQIITP